MPDDAGPHPLSHVLLEEYEAIKPEAMVTDCDGSVTILRDEIGSIGAGIRSKNAAEAARLRYLYSRGYQLQLAALCLSGGGIRSAAISLGVIQGLVDAKLMKKFHYLSTVSGGGYIGAWLSAWLHYSGNADAVLDRLGSKRNDTDRETPPLAHLREYSNYLTPRLGLFSADTWAAVAIVFRNILVNWLILVPTLALLVMAIKLVPLAMTTAGDGRCLRTVIAAVCVLAGGMALGYKLGRLYAPPDITPRCKANTAQRRFLCWSLAPSIVAGLCFVWLALQHVTPADALLPQAAAAAPSLVRMLLFAGVVYLVALVVGFFWATPEWHAGVLGRNRPFAIHLRDVICWVGAVAVFAGMLWLGLRSIAGLSGMVTLVSQIACVTSTNACVPDAHAHPVALAVEGETLAVIFGLPWFLLATVLAHTTYLLLRSASREGDVEREWLGRASGWHLIAGLGWIMLQAVVLIGPWVFYNLTLTVNVLTAVSGAVTGLLGKSGITSAKGGGTPSWTSLGANVALAVAGPLFAALLLILLSVAVDWSLTGSSQQCFPPDGTWAGPGGNPCLTPRWGMPIGLAIAVLLAANLLANVNAFSLHAVYRNRLMRGFLGGGRSPHRAPDGFTDFDWDDDVRVASLWNPKPPLGEWRPLHVINMTLNLAETNHLAWQERKAMPFSVTPFACGNADLGYRSTDCYGGERVAAVAGAPPPMSGMSLGTAMAISGAAVSSSMGYHSSMSLSFLMTFFNVRLGVWLGNPGWRGRGEPYRRSGPRFAARPLLAELFGLTTADSPYVNLSDGGHFEDFGLYEMVRRRCRWIVLVDGGEDAERGFADLGNAVRKIWIDLGVRISFADSPLLGAEKDAKAAGVPYFAVGTISYLSDAPVGDPPAPPEGRVLYLKPVVRGDEAAADVIAYKRAHDAFPDQTTADQWFDESQFESYRRLGQLMVERIVAAAGGKLKHAALGLDELITGLDGVDPTKVPPPPKWAAAQSDPTAQDNT